MKWAGRGRPLIKWAGIGTRAILYTPRGLQAFMNIRYTMRASDVDSVQQLVKMGYDLRTQHPNTTFYPSIGLHTTDFSDFFRGSGIKKNNMGDHPTGPYIVVRPKTDEDVMHRFEMVAEGIWVAQKAQVGVMVVWPNTGNSSILFTEGFVVKDGATAHGCQYIRFIHHERSGTTSHYTKHALCLGVMSQWVPYSEFANVWNHAVRQVTNDESLTISPADDGPYRLHRLAGTLL
jgi:hypothetical protein